MLSPSAQEATASLKSDEASEPSEDTVKPKLKMGLIENVRKLWDSVRMTVFVIGTALTVFVAARNTITWYVYKICVIQLKEIFMLVFIIISASLTIHTWQSMSVSTLGTQLLPISSVSLLVCSSVGPESVLWQNV